VVCVRIVGCSFSWSRRWSWSGLDVMVVVGRENCLSGWCVRMAYPSSTGRQSNVRVRSIDCRRVENGVGWVLSVYVDFEKLSKFRIIPGPCVHIRHSILFISLNFRPNFFSKQPIHYWLFVFYKKLTIFRPLVFYA